MAVPFGVSAQTASAAEAADCFFPGCATLIHEPDTGYQPPFTIRCQGYTTNHYLAEGHSSKEFCKDVGRIYVHVNEEIVCRDAHTPGGWSTKWDATGWHDVHNTKPNGEWKCVAQRLRCTPLAQTRRWRRA